MKKFYRAFWFVVFEFFLLALSPGSFSQVQTPRTITTSANSNGFYEYLPEGYNTGSEKYPLMVFIHGLDELGNGGSDLPRVLVNGPPKLISKGLFPTSFTVNSTVFRFIIISPQFIDWPVSTDVDAVITYAINHYRVDQRRIYLTGLSMGGGVVWAYSGDDVNLGKKLAAILPISGAAWPDPTRAHNIGSLNLPVWATHNLNDGTVPVMYTNTYIDLINTTVPAPIPLAKKTIFPVSGHDAWTKTYDPAFTENGMNVYQWMLQYQLFSAPLPIVLGAFTAQASNNHEVVLRWNTLSESNNRNFVIERSTDGQHFIALDTVPAANDPNGHDYSLIDQAPVAGRNYYRLNQVDLDGKQTNYNTIYVNMLNPEKQEILQLYPNPAYNNIEISLSTSSVGLVEIKLLDLQGQVLKSWTYQKDSQFWKKSINLSGIAAGSYLIQVNGSKINSVKQFVKH